jgi:hypothetical protein
MGKDEPQPPIEMLRLATGWTWSEIEQMTDASGNSSDKIADMKAARAAVGQSADASNDKRTSDR